MFECFVWAVNAFLFRCFGLIWKGKIVAFVLINHRLEGMEHALVQDVVV